MNKFVALILAMLLLVLGSALAQDSEEELPLVRRIADSFVDDLEIAQHETDRYLGGLCMHQRDQLAIDRELRGEGGFGGAGSMETLQYFDANVFFPAIIGFIDGEGWVQGDFLPQKNFQWVYFSHPDKPNTALVTGINLKANFWCGFQIFGIEEAQP